MAQLLTPNRKEEHQFMRRQLYRITLCSILTYLALSAPNSAGAASQPSGGNGTHFCAVIDWQADNRRYTRAFAPNLNVGEPRTVRMIYFLPNDRPYRAEVVQHMKDEILNIQTFYAEQMEVHGYGEVTFRVETDSQGEPIVHRVDGDHPDTHYLDNTIRTVLDEINLAFNPEANVYLIVIDNSIDVLVQGGADGGEHPVAGVGVRQGKNGGIALLPDEFVYKITVHELGHAFGLGHDFRDRAYIMSYGPGQDRLSPCSAEFLSVHPYFNLNTPIEKGEPPTIKLISPPTYPAGSQSVPIRLKVNDSEGLHQLLLFVNGGVADVGLEVKACRRLAGDRDFVVEFDYDGVIPSDGLTSLSVPAIHPIFVEVVDIDGNSGNVSFSLTVEPSMEDRRDAEVEVDIPDPNLRAAIAEEIGLPPNTPILRGHLENLTFLDARNANISDLTGLETATNLRILNLGSKYVEGENRPLNSNSVSDISPLSGLTYLGWLYLGNNNVLDISPLSGLNLKRLNLGNNNVSDISAVAGSTNLTELNLGENLISDISAIAGLTNLIWLYLEHNSILDISAVAGLTNLTTLQFWDNLISDISAVAGLTNLKTLSLPNNSVSDISAVAGLTNLTRLNLGNNSVSDISPLVENTGLAGGDHVDLWGNPLNYPSIYKHIPALQERGVEVVFYSRMPHRIRTVSDDNQKGLPSAVLEQPLVVEVQDERGVAFEGVPVTFTVTSGGGTLSTQTTTTDSNGRAESTLTLGPNPGTNTVEATVTGIEEKRTFTAEGIRIPKTLEIISGVNQAGLPGDALEKAFVVEVRDQFDKPLPGVEVTFSVSSGGGTLSTQTTTTDSNGRAESILTLGPNLGKNSVRVSVEGISQPESFTAVGIRPQFDLSLLAGISLIHIPIRATAVDEVPLTIESMSDLYDALGGAEKVNFLVTRDAALQRWRIYFGSQNRGMSGDQALTDDLGIIAAMKDAVTIRLGGDALGRDGNSAIRLPPGTNLVGVPLRDSRIMRVSDLLSLEGIRGNVPSIFVSAQGKFVEVRRAADDGNISITGGQSFVLTAQRAARVAISGNGWYNTSGTTAAPSVAVTGIEAGDATPVLAFSGSIVDEVRVWSERGRDAPPTGSGFRVTVKNLSTSKAVTAVTGDEHLSLPDKVKLIGVGYQLAVVDMESGACGAGWRCP